MPEQTCREVYSLKNLFVAVAFMLLVSCARNGTEPTVPGSGVGPVSVTKKNPATLFAHYMPWFQSKEVSGKWGIHWTMTNRNPDNVDSSGKREIAAYYYPAIGPYDSNDPDLLMYHAMLLKLSGIDGVFFDWYGTTDFYDWNIIRKNTETAVSIFQKAGLKFGIMYEDAVLKIALDNEKIASFADGGKKDFEYLRTNFFTNPNYLRKNGKPVVLVFGPQGVGTNDDWNNIFSVFSQTERPDFLALWYHSQLASTVTSGEYMWISENHLDDLNRFYNTRLPAIQPGLYISSVYPGFRSYYEKGGWKGNLWSIDHLNGQTLRNTIQLAANNNSAFMQIATWNDFGEGTMIEPTQEFGYDYLDQIQKLAGVSYTVDDLKLAETFYRLRKKYRNDSAKRLQLEQVFSYVCRLQLAEARKLLIEIGQ